jgi:hypothetical protein
MTVAQWGRYFKLFGEVCDKLGIPSKDRDAYRKQLHTAVFGAPISAKDIDHEEMFGKIKNHFLMLLDNVKGTVETDHPEHDAQRRLLNHIRGYQFPLLRALGVDGEQYIRPIIRNRWRAEILEDVSAEPETRYGKPGHSPLEKLRFDIQRAIQSKRAAKGWTVHELHVAAELQCPGYTGCLICYPKAARAAALAEQLDNVPF